MFFGAIPSSRTDLFPNVFKCCVSTFPRMSSSELKHISAPKVRRLCCHPGTCSSSKWRSWLQFVSEQIPEHDWKEKQKVMDDLLRTVELQKKDLNNLQKVVNVKEKLCSALRVSLPTAFCSSGYHRIALRFYFGLFYFPQRNRWHTWNHNTTTLRLPERRLEDSGSRWRPLKGVCSCSVQTVSRASLSQN